MGDSTHRSSGSTFSCLASMIACASGSDGVGRALARNAVVLFRWLCVLTPLNRQLLAQYYSGNLLTTVLKQKLNKQSQCGLAERAKKLRKQHPLAAAVFFGCLFTLCSRLSACRASAAQARPHSQTPRQRLFHRLGSDRLVDADVHRPRVHAQFSNKEPDPRGYDRSLPGFLPAHC